MASPNPEENEAQQLVSEAEDIGALKKTLAEEKARAEANLAGWQRAQADLINYKRYSEQDKADAIKFANTQLMRAVLPVMDDFERAIAAIPAESAKQSWVEGVKLIERKLRASLELQGLICIPALGEAFDPCVHEAIACDTGKRDIVIKEIEKGYRLHERVIRPARVIVGSGEEEPKKEE